MTGGMVVMSLNGLVTASSNASAIDHEQQHKSGDAVPKRIADHGSGGMVWIDISDRGTHHSRVVRTPSVVMMSCSHAT